MALHFPPLDNSLLFPDLINFHMERNPSFPMFVYANESTPRLNEISFLEFARAAHRVAHALRPGRQDSDGEVVMVIANTDTILHHAIVAGLSLAGWVPFPVSHRNSAAAVVSMINKTNCSRIVTLGCAHKDLIDAIRGEVQDTELAIYEVPTLRYAFPKLGREVATDPFVPYPPALTRPNLGSPAIYIHSSGSTGFPKPIMHTHRLQIQWLTHDFMRQSAEMPLPRRMAGMALPALHTFGIIAGLYVPIAALVSIVVYAPRTESNPLAQPVTPTSDNIIKILEKIECNFLSIVPALLEQMATSEEAIKVLKKIDTVLFGGGPLPVKTGDTLYAAGVQLVSAYGGTEFGAPVMQTDKKDFADGDWMWMRFSQDYKVRWESQGNDMYELLLLTTDRHLFAVENIPDVRGYATSDVFVKHPTKDAWRIVGRADDVIILASGEKTVPAPMEDVISSSPLVQGVVMFGRERNQVGVLIEPREGYAINVNDEKTVSDFRNQIWPVIEEANKPSPAFSRIFKEMILITNKDKPMSRASKGTVQRKATLSVYEEEINALYETVEASSEVEGGSTAPSAWTSEAVGAWLLKHARAINSNRPIDPHADLFAQGFDSLSVTYLRNQILGALRISSDPAVKQAASHIPPNIVFENPTLQQLSMRIVALTGGDSAGQAISVIEQHKQIIQALIEKYSVGLSGRMEGTLPSSAPINSAVVLLTGTTGGLGSFLLSALLQGPSIERVYAFNRPSPTRSIEERQRAVFRDRGLALDLLDSHKLVYVEADASLDKCGLSPTQYEEIRDSVTLIIHNAWRLDFNLTISSFEDSIRASRNLVDLGLDSRHKESLRFLFTSSVGSAQGWDKAKGYFPEQVQLDSSVAVGTGYGEAKYVTERIIVKSGLRATSLRIGQIAGGHGGSWATTDWFPIIVKSSMALGALPECAGAVSWLREEEVTAAILETAFSRQVPPPALNIVNPRNVPWADVIGFVQRAIERRKGVRLQVVPFDEWFAMLQRRGENASEDDLGEMPAIKLLEFLGTLARGDRAARASGKTRVMTEAGSMISFSTTEAQRVSPTMARMQAVGETEADAWVEYWIRKGAF